MMSTKITVRKHQSIEMRARIQRMAMNLFEKHGFENVTVDDIARAVGCSVGNIYHYFKSKEELSLQVVSNVDAKYVKLSALYNADTVHTGKEKLLDFVEQVLMICVQDEFIYNGIIHGIKYPEQGVLKYRQDRAFFKVIKQLLCVCQQEGSIRQEYMIEEIMEIFVILIRGTLIEWRINEGCFDLQACGRRHALLLLKGLESYQP